MSEQMLRIVPFTEADSGGPVRTMGTRVVTPSGDEVKGVYRIVLTADVNDIWRAEIHCHVQPPAVTAPTKVRVGEPISRWRRFLLRLAGVKYVDITDLVDRKHEVVRP